MKTVLVRLALSLLRLGGESTQAAQIEHQLATRAAVQSSIQDMREAERWTAEARARLERLDAQGNNMARDDGNSGE